MKWMPMKRLRPIRRGGKPRNRDRRRVGGEHRLRSQQGADHREDLALDLLVLGGRLDHQVAIAERREVWRRCDAVHRLGGGVVFDLPLLGKLAEARVDGIDASPGLGFRDVVQQDVDAGKGADLSDPGSPSVPRR